MCRKLKLSFSPSMRSNMFYPDIYYVFCSKIINPKKKIKLWTKLSLSQSKNILAKIRKYSQKPNFFFYNSTYCSFIFYMFS